MTRSLEQNTIHSDTYLSITNIQQLNMDNIQEIRILKFQSSYKKKSKSQIFFNYNRLKQKNDF